MIALHSDCLMFQLANGESVPCSADMICVEVTGHGDIVLDPDLLRHATASVFHYFKVELARQTVTVGEFAGALEKVLQRLGLAIHAGTVESRGGIAEADLRHLAGECGAELFFFPRLREELRFQLSQSPQLLRFRGLRGCVKRLAGARRWSLRCEKMQDQIVEYLRGCFSAEKEQNDCALVVE